MRFFFVLYLLSGIFLTLNALEWEDEYEDAHAKALQENKIIYVFIAGESCHWCRKMEDTTMRNKEVLKRLEKNFISVELIRGFDNYPDMFKTKMVPKHFFLTSNEKKIYTIPGYWDTENFISILDNVVSEYKKIKGKKQ